MLADVQSDLFSLCDYLMARGHGASIRHIRLVHDPLWDAENASNSRAFCYVKDEGEPTVYYAAAFTSLPQNARVGILLHEVVHLGKGWIGNPEHEADVDAWILAYVPDSDYHYKDCIYSFNGQARVARNIQHVSQEFLTDIGAA